MKYWISCPFQTPFCVETEENGLIANLKLKYGPYCRTEGDPECPHFSAVRPEEGGYRITWQGEEFCYSSPLGFFSREMGRCRRFSPRVFALHGGAVAWKGRAYVFLAATTTGKTTLTAYLTQQGLDYLTDDCVLIDRETLEVLPCITPIHLRAGGVEVLRQWGACPPLNHLADVGFERWVFTPARCVETPLPLGKIFFLHRTEDENGVIPLNTNEIFARLLKAPLVEYHAANTHQLAPFVKKTENPLCPYINVDVNTDLFWGESEKMADLSRVLAETQTVSVCDVSLQKMTAEYEFVALCLHHYKDMNSLYLLYNRGLPLGHLCDIYDYIHAAPLQADKLTKICEEMEVSPYVKACILLAIRIFGTDDSTEALLQGLEGPDLSNFFGLKAEEYRIWELPLSHRIFGNIRHYLDDILSPQEQEKIRLNNSIMNS